MGGSLKAVVRKYSIGMIAFAALSLVAQGVVAGDITPKMQPKIDAYKKQAAEWAANPEIVKAVKEVTYAKV